MTARQLERTLADLEREEREWEELDLDMVPVSGSMWTRKELNEEAYGTAEPYGWTVADPSTED